MQFESSDTGGKAEQLLLQKKTRPNAIKKKQNVIKIKENSAGLRCNINLLIW